MEIVGNILIVLGVIAFWVSVIGLIKPSWIKMQNRKEVMQAMLGSFLFLIIGVILAPTPPSKPADKPAPTIAATEKPTTDKADDAKPEATPKQANDAKPETTDAKPEPEQPKEKTVETYKTTASKLFSDYEANEVATDEKISGKPVEISGSVESIDKDFLNNIIINIRTSNPFMPARLTLEDSEKDKAMKASKGNKVTLVCQKMMRIIGSPAGSDCVFK
jgi:hypothetical protein